MHASDTPFMRSAEVALEELLPGCTVVDRDLEVEGGPSADLVCVDEDGRLHLLMHVEGGAEETVLSALDAVSFAKRHASVLVSHCAGGMASAELAPRIVLLGRHFAERALERLAPLIEERDPTLLVFEVRSIQSTAKEGTWFAPVLSSSKRTAVVRISLVEFIGELPTELQPVAKEITDRLAHLDPELRAEVTRSRVLWRLGADELCALSLSDDALEVHVLDASALSLSASSDLEPVLENIMNRYLHLLGAEDRDALFDDEPDEESLLMPARPAALLTQEEIEAFHEP